jgi:hypothetical protein
MARKMLYKFETRRSGIRVSISGQIISSGIGKWGIAEREIKTGVPIKIWRTGK